MAQSVPLVLLLATAIPLAAHDWLIVPGKRVGPITATSTESSLRAAFGSSAAVRATIQIDKKTTAAGLEIYPGKPGESLAVVWPRQERGLWWPLLVIPCYRSAGAQCRWRTAEGVRPGLSLADLEQLNAKPFLLYASPERNAWTEPSWNEGKLAAQLGEDVELSLEDSNYQFYEGAAYVASNQPPLAGRNLQISGLLVFLLSSHRAPPANDWTIVPGQRIGPIPLRAAIEPLRETLGAAQVHQVVTQAEEGLGDIPAISIFGSQTGREVLLARDGNLVCGGSDGYKTCQWHIAGGIPLTATVETLEKINGRPFVFNGCCFDLGGIVTSWEGGRMDAAAGARYAVACEGDQPERLTGEVSVRSNDAEIRKEKCTVTAISF